MKHKAVSRDKPCEACGKYDWCARLPDGGLRCERTDRPPHGFELVKRVGGGAIFAPAGSRRQRQNGHAPRPVRSEPERPDWAREAERCAGAITDDQVSALAAELGVAPAALRDLGIGWASGDDLKRWRAGGAGWGDAGPDGAFVFLERDGRGQVVGLSLRAIDGRKGSPSGARRGLILPASLRTLPPGVTLIVEGASDVAACATLGLRAVGRPSNTGGAHELAELLRDEEVLIVGENDAKPGGAWPGRDGARRVAQRLATAWGKPVAYTLPPPDAKDIRAWLQARASAGVGLADAAACKAARAALLAALSETAKPILPVERSQADWLVELAQEHYRLGVALDGEAFAVATDGPNIALMLRGSRDALRAALSRQYYNETGKAPSASALTDALCTLAGIAAECEPEPVHLRVAPHEGGMVIDLGDSTGRAAVVGADGWRVADTSPVLFRRTALTSALPEPVPGGDVAELRDLLHIAPDSWPLLLAWLAAAFFGDTPRPILSLGGPQGVGKSTAARRLLDLIDPSPAPLRCEPRDPEQWSVAAAGSFALCVDNVSGIATWFSDALCKAVTGDGLLKRRLYSDSEIVVLAFRRAIILTSIDFGALRGDLADRWIGADLAPIAPDARRTESELGREWAAARPRLFGALLGLVADVLRVLPSIELAELPRMADFGRICAAVDSAAGTDSLPRYLAQRGRLLSDAASDDPVGAAVLALVAARGPWAGSAADLLSAITPERPPHGWPRAAAALGGRLKRLAPCLAEAGLIVDSRREHGGRRITLRPAGVEREAAPLPELPPVPEPAAAAAWGEL